MSKYPELFQHAAHEFDQSPNALSVPNCERHAMLLKFPSHLPLRTWLGFLINRMPFIGAGNRKFTKFVSNHFFCDKDRNMCTAVMYSNSQSHHFWHDHGATRPSLDRALIIFFQSRFYLFNKVQIYKRAFL